MYINFSNADTFGETGSKLFFFKWQKQAISETVILDVGGNGIDTLLDPTNLINLNVILGIFD